MTNDMSTAAMKQTPLPINTNTSHGEPVILPQPSAKALSATSELEATIHDLSHLDNNARISYLLTYLANERLANLIRQNGFYKIMSYLQEEQQSDLLSLLKTQSELPNSSIEITDIKFFEQAMTPAAPQSNLKTDTESTENHTVITEQFNQLKAGLVPDCAAKEQCRLLRLHQGKVSQFSYAALNTHGEITHHKCCQLEIAVDKDRHEFSDKEFSVYGLRPSSDHPSDSYIDFWALFIAKYQIQSNRNVDIKELTNLLGAKTIYHLSADTISCIKRRAYQLQIRWEADDSFFTNRILLKGKRKYRNF